jgi:hypothetical protein
MYPGITDFDAIFAKFFIGMRELNFIQMFTLFGHNHLQFNYMQPDALTTKIFGSNIAPT